MKSVFLKLDKLFFKFSHTAFGSWILKGKSIISAIIFFGASLIGQISVYNITESYIDKINIQLANTSGLEHFMWILISFLVPEGNIFVIIVLLLIFISLVVLKLKYANIDDEFMTKKDFEDFINCPPLTQKEADEDWDKA